MILFQLEENSKSLDPKKLIDFIQELVVLTLEIDRRYILQKLI